MLKALIIDDEKHILTVLGMILAKFDISVETAASAFEGIEKYSRKTFDIVITDILMPGQDGFAVVEYIRRCEKCHTPVIGMSGTPWLLSTDTFDAVLEKPFSSQSLMETITRLIEGYPPQSE